LAAFLVIVAGAAGAKAELEPPPSEMVRLDGFLSDNSPDPRIIAKKHGEINFLDHYSYEHGFKPFLPADPTTYANPIGDRLGYDTCGLNDVDGDGFNDWVETWYHAEPRHPKPDLLHSCDVDRLHTSGAVIVPVVDHFNGLVPVWKSVTPAGVQTANFERVGFCRVISGATGEPIGEEIWGGSDNGRFAHELARMQDIDGDQNAEVAFSTNTAEGGSGAIYVYSFTNRYNVKPEANPTLDISARHWVCIMMIVGDASTSELAYQMSDNFVDINGDGQQDILAASVWWRTSGGRDIVREPDEPAHPIVRNQRGAGWVFLTPVHEVFEAIAGDESWPVLPDSLPDGTLVKVPLVMRESDASVTIHNPVAANNRRLPVADLASAGDMDNDGKIDLVINSGYEPYAQAPSGPEGTEATGGEEEGGAGSGEEEGGGASPGGGSGGVTQILNQGGITGQATSPQHLRGFFFFLSHDGYDKADTSTDPSSLSPRWVVDACNKAARQASMPQISLTPDDAEFVIHGCDVPLNTTITSWGKWYNFEYNNNSVFGMQFDNDPVGNASPLNSDMAICANRIDFDSNGNGQIKPGTIKLLLDLPRRFDYLTGSLRAQVDRATHSHPATFDFAHTPGGAEYVIKGWTTDEVIQDSSHVRWYEGHYVTGVNRAGDINGSAGGDCELFVDTVQSEHDAFFPTGTNTWFTRGYALVVDVPTHTPGSAYTDLDTSPLMTIQGESEPTDGNAPDPNVTPPDAGFSGRLDVNPNYQGCIGEPAWDQDGDGHADIIIRSPFLPALVTEVANAANCHEPLRIPLVNGRAPRYWVDGGGDYLVLSPANPLPAPPQFVSRTVAIEDGECIITISGPRLISPHLPFTFTASEISFVQDGWDRPYMFDATHVDFSMNKTTRVVTLTLHFPLDIVGMSGTVFIPNRSAGEVSVSVPAD